MQYELWFEWVGYTRSPFLKAFSSSSGKSELFVWSVGAYYGYTKENDMGFADVYALYPYKSKANRVRRYIAYQRLLNPQFPYYVAEEVPDGCGKEAVLEIKRGLE